MHNEKTGCIIPTEKRDIMKKLNGILWGVVFILLGVAILLNVTDVADIDLLFEGWWTLFIIVPCTIELITGEDRLGSLFGLGVGVALLLAAQDIIDFSLVWKLAVPAVFILIGVKIIFGSITAKKAKKIKMHGQSQAQHVAIFSGVEADYTAMEFTSADAVAVFGGAEIDLRNAVINGDIYINACSVFGGMDILLPENVEVKSSVVSIFGGTENKHRPLAAPHTLYLSGCCIFGGIDIK